MRFNEFLHLVIDRAMLDNKHGFATFVDFFDNSIKPSMAESPDINAKNERKMSKSQFYHFLPEIAEKLYPGHKEKVELMFKNLLTERPMLNLKEASKLVPGGLLGIYLKVMQREI